jgi:N-acyl-D-amino-acid deacylase
MAFFVGHNTLRQAAGVSGPVASEAQMQAMEAMLRDAMESGALGLSTGLEFEPGRTAPIEEIIRLNRVVGQYDGYYTSHIRNRAVHLQEAMDEFMAIVRSAGTRGQVSHLNVRYNTGAPEDAWQRAVETVERARAEGLSVLADCTPFQDGLGQLAGILPPWVKEEGPAHAAELLRDPAIRARLRNECDRYWSFIHRGDWHRVRMLQSVQFPELAGLSFPQIARLWNKDEWECYFDILAAAGEAMDEVLVIGELFTDEHVADMVRNPLFMLAVDGFTATVDGPLGRVVPHPLNFAGMMHYLTYHVREKHTLRLEEAIRKMTSMPATHFGLRDRGVVRPGGFADVVVFDLDQLDEVATLEKPLAYAQGIDYVLVNGQIVVDDGVHTGARPGRALRYE